MERTLWLEQSHSWVLYIYASVHGYTLLWLIVTSLHIIKKNKAGIIITINVFCDRMKAALDELAPGHGIKMQLVEDGSGRGAAFVAAVACRLTAAGE